VGWGWPSLATQAMSGAASCTAGLRHSRPAVVEDVGARVVAALGQPAARELLEVLEWSDGEATALIGRLHACADELRHEVRGL
jgi:hypothetical protein